MYHFTLFCMWQNNMELYRSTLFCLPIHPLMDIQIVSTIGPMSTMLLWISMDKFLFEHIFSIICGIYLGVEFLNWPVIVFFYLFEETPNCCIHCLPHFTFPQAICKGSSFSTLLPAFLFVLDYNHLTYLKTVLCSHNT